MPHRIVLFTISHSPPFQSWSLGSLRPVSHRVSAVPEFPSQCWLVQQIGTDSLSNNMSLIWYCSYGSESYGPPGSSVHWILQARTLEWVAIPSSRGSSQPRDQTQVSYIAGRFSTIWATGKPTVPVRGILSFWLMTLPSLGLGTVCTEHELLRENTRGSPERPQLRPQPSKKRWEKQWQPAPVLLPGESQGLGSLVSCCLWGCTESDTTEVT